MDADIWKFAITFIGSGGLVAALLKIIGPALKLNSVGNDSSARAIAQWEKLYAEQKEESAAALAALEVAKESAAKSEARASKAERKTADLEARLAIAFERIRQLEEKSP
jgi:hypothetical protein